MSEEIIEAHKQRVMHYCRSVTQLMMEERIQRIILVPDFIRKITFSFEQPLLIFYIFQNLPITDYLKQNILLGYE